MLNQVCRRSGLAALSALTAATTLVAGAGLAAASPSPAPIAQQAKIDCVTVNVETGRCELAGTVYAIAHIGTTTYVGGNFKSVSGVPRSNVAAIRADGSLDPSWNPSTDGVVYALAVSADRSKIFLGGAFLTVGTDARRGLAAVDPVLGEVQDSWTTVANNTPVRALVADSRDRLYVGGNFTKLGGKVAPKLGAVNQVTGAVAEGLLPQPSATVRALTLSEDESKLYAGGPFTSIGGVARPGVAELDTSTGALTGFAPTDGGVVISMDVTPSGRLFFGTTTNRTWAYEPSKGGVPEYRVRSGGDVQAILATDEEVYVGGHFTNFPEAKQSRPGIASFRPGDGSANLLSDGTQRLTAWNPGASVTHFGVWAIALTQAQTTSSPEGSVLSIGGDFTRVGGVARRGYARFSFEG